MPRPWRDPITGLFYIRVRVPKALVDLVGRTVVKRSLGTKDPEEAKRRFPAALAKLQSTWAPADAVGEPSSYLTERQAHRLAAPLARQFAEWFREEPTQFETLGAVALCVHGCASRRGRSASKEGRLSERRTVGRPNILGRRDGKNK